MCHVDLVWTMYLVWTTETKEHLWHMGQVRNRWHSGVVPVGVAPCSRGRRFKKWNTAGGCGIHAQCRREYWAETHPDGHRAGRIRVPARHSAFSHTIIPINPCTHIKID